MKFKKCACILCLVMLLPLLSGCSDSLRKDAPEGYPHRLVPLYGEGDAHVTGSSSQSMKNYESFTVSVTTGDSPDVVGAAIKKALGAEEDGGESGDVCSFGAVILSGKTGKWEYNITIESLGDAGGSEITYFVKTAQDDE